MATEHFGYYTGYVFFEKKYLVLIYFETSSTLSSGDNQHTDVKLRTYTLDEKYEEIRGMKDFWYQIRYKDKIDWIFGSQTNVKKGMQSFTAATLGEIWSTYIEIKEYRTKHMDDDQSMFTPYDTISKIFRWHETKKNLKIL